MNTFAADSELESYPEGAREWRPFRGFALTFFAVFRRSSSQEASGSFHQYDYKNTNVIPAGNAGIQGHGW
jgi:hypothetical protein